MELSFPAFKYLLLFALIVGWIYYRLVRTMRRRGKLHGRHLWRAKLNQHRVERLEGAKTWNERRSRKQGLMPERKIADCFLGSTQGDDGGVQGTDPAREDVPSMDGDANKESEE